MPRNARRHNNLNAGKRAFHDAAIDATQVRKRGNKLHRRTCNHALIRIVNGTLDPSTAQADDLVMRVSKHIKRLAKANFFCVVVSS